MYFYICFDRHRAFEAVIQPARTCRHFEQGKGSYATVVIVSVCCVVCKGQRSGLYFNECLLTLQGDLAIFGLLYRLTGYSQMLTCEEL